MNEWNYSIFESERHSIHEFSHDEFSAFLEVLDVSRKQQDYFVDGEGPVLPEWLAEFAKNWKKEMLYYVDLDSPLSDETGLIYNEKTGEGWVYGANYHTSSRLIDVELQPGELTPEKVWPVVSQVIRTYGDAHLWGSLRCNPNLVPRKEMESLLKEQLQEEGMERLGGGDGPTVEEWAENIYAKKHTP